MSIFRTKKFWAIVLVVVIVTQVVGLGLLWRSERHTNTIARDLLQQNINMTGQIFTVSNAVSFTRPVISVADNAVYFPDVRLKLPLNSTTMTLLYSVRQTESASDPKVLDVNTIANATYIVPSQQTIECTPLRLAFESKPNPYNPHETDAASVKLADGRTLQVYSYHNAVCNVQFADTQTDSDALAAQFKSATSY